MHQIKLLDVNQSEKKLTQAVLQITQMLGIYHAELARILHLQCADIGALNHANKFLARKSVAWVQAEKYIQLFECLYAFTNGNDVLMNNWLRKKNRSLLGIPLYLMVDELRIDDVLEVLRIDT